MLTAAQRDIVKSTVPLLETGGEALTTHFYQLLLSRHPQVKPLFNQAHQASGAQPRALAQGVLMYARHIDQLEALGDLAARIVQKHVALQVQPEHYPLVGECLLQAIREVLGAEVATEAVIAAWAAAYGQLADLLIGAERSMYAAQAAAPGGWTGARAFRVAARVTESAEVTSFVLEPVDAGRVARFEPGQYLTLRLTLDGEDVRRNYSLSAGPDGRTYRISVKKEPGGRVSRHLHEAVNAGDVLDVFPPAGAFTLPAGDGPLVLIGGGVGVTPLLSMLEAVAPAGRRVTFIHCARNPLVQPFRAHIDAIAARHPNVTRHYCVGEPGEGVGPADAIGVLGLEHLRDWLPDDRSGADVCFVGPPPFMQAVRRHLKALGVPDARTRWEFFGPAAALA